MAENVRLSTLVDKKEAQLLAINELWKMMALYSHGNFWYGGSLEWKMCYVVLFVVNNRMLVGSWMEQEFALQIYIS